MDVMTRIAFDWGVRCFGKEHMTNRSIRALRCAEEAIELTQSLNVSRELMHKLVDTVYSRPHGDPVQELGGVLLTAAVLSLIMRGTPSSIFEGELRRCLSKEPKEFAARNQQKLDLGLDTNTKVEMFTTPPKDDIQRFLQCFEALSKFEAMQRVIHSMGAFDPKEWPDMPDPAVVRVLHWLRKLGHEAGI